MLDGACQISKLAARCQELEMPALAVTDHGNMHGAIEFHTEMQEAGIKPILGCEFYLAPGSRLERTQEHPHHKGYHQIVFAANLEGYRNLCRLNAKAYLEGYYFKPRIDREILAEHAEGLIGTSACIGGEIPACIREGNLREARRLMGEYRDIFGKDSFYLELQDHGMPEQRLVNEKLIELNREFNLPFIATNDIHYLLKEHARSHEVVLCIGTQKTMQDEGRLRFPFPEFYFKSADEMAALFGEVPGALSNTLEIAERCNVELALETENHYPVFHPPDGVDRLAYITKLCREALVERYDIDLERTPRDQLPEAARPAVDRMEYEIGVIDKMGFISYFLVVWDFLSFARRRGIPIGPGRGSGAGSIVAYLLRITDIEPLSYGLLFERFLNPDRISPPDFDIDLCERRRVEVIDYVRERYGGDNVAQIATFGTLKAKAAIKDVARVLGRSFEEGNRLTKLIPGDPKMTLEKALRESRELQQAKNDEAWVSEVYEQALPLEGLNRNMSIHAAGVLIGDQPLTNLVPLAKAQKGEVITQYPAGPCEALGLLKMDFLGLRTLTVIQDACDLLKKSQGVEIDPDNILLEDAETFKLLQQGQTVAVFQLESGPMRDLCRRFGIVRIEDIIALVALYRPGPMQFIDEFVSRKHGQTPVDYDVPATRAILEETYGIMLYQEQVMQVVQQVAGFTLGQADILRRAMGKKKPEEMAAQHELFMEGCSANNVATSVAESIWAKVERFAGYGFNKSHSAAYGILAYRTAYLKTNYPVEFMAANLTNDMRSSDRVSELIAECRHMDIAVLPPDVSNSEMAFTVDGKDIRFGLAAIKGIGAAAAEAIIQARADGPFTELQDFCERAGSAVNRRLLESLVQSGAFDCLGLQRSQTFSMIDEAIDLAQTSLRDREVGQETFFDILAGDDGDANGMQLTAPDIPEWPEAQRLKYEKDLLGFYVTGHPLNRHQKLLKKYRIGRIRDSLELPTDEGVRFGGLIAGLDRKISKRDGHPWAIIDLEDFDASIECLIYSETYAECAPAVIEEAPVFVEGVVTRREQEDQPQIVVSKVIPVDDVERCCSKELYVRLEESQTTEDFLREVAELLRGYPGETAVVLAVYCADGQKAFIEAGGRFRVAVTDELKVALRRALGDDCYRLKADRTLPKREKRAWDKASAS